MLRGSIAAGPQAAPQSGAGTGIADAADAATVHRAAGSRPGGRLDSPAGGGRDDSDLAATVNRPQAPEPVLAETTADHGKRNLWLAVAGGAALVVAVVVGLVLGSSRPEPVVDPTGQVSKPPADALDNGTVPDVTNLVGARGAAGKAKFTWTNPQPKPGDTFKWRIYDVQATGPYQATGKPEADVALDPSGTTCIQVMIVRSDGASSPMELDSIGCVPRTRRHGTWGI